MNLNEILSPFVCLGYNFSVKWFQIKSVPDHVRKKDSFDIISYSIVASNVEFHGSDISFNFYHPVFFLL